MANLNGHAGGNAGDGQGAPKATKEGGKPLAEGMEKGAGQRECEPAKHAPDAVPGKCAQCAGSHKAGSEGRAS